MKQQLNGLQLIPGWYLTGIYPYRSAMVKSPMIELPQPVVDSIDSGLADYRLSDNHIVLEMTDLNHSFYVMRSDGVQKLSFTVEEKDW
ncbi:hypothetical protein ACQ4M3_12985 [Leptolyngbya sp. AN03gr2]|uniref:hypothetical protein n=1 Tax=unclassified Leptolyngbya TaxID=2650499 RepID=UPI003D31DDA6